ncbi:hypothetical protein BDR26DRAFT_942056 [Obelidium mucronatum]|nr:hypothetical protein BDR26DRAFT_942056 [Obelidium mucronatum]
MLGNDWDQNTTAVAPVPLLDYIASSTSSADNLPENLADVLKQLDEKCGVVKNGLGIADILRSESSYGRQYFTDPAGYFVSVKSKQQDSLVPAAFLFPCEVLNQTDGIFYPATPLTNFLVASVYCRSLLSPVLAKGLTDFLKKCKGVTPKQYDFGTTNGKNWIRFTRTFWPPSAQQPNTNTPHKGTPSRASVGTPSQQQHQKPPPPNRPYSLHNGTPFLPIYDCRVNEFNLRNLDNNDRLRDVLLPGDKVLVSATCKLDRMGEAAAASLWAVGKFPRQASCAEQKWWILPQTASSAAQSSMTPLCYPGRYCQWMGLLAGFQGGQAVPSKNGGFCRKLLRAQLYDPAHLLSNFVPGEYPFLGFEVPGEGSTAGKDWTEVQKATVWEARHRGAACGAAVMAEAKIGQVTTSGASAENAMSAECLAAAAVMTLKIHMLKSCVSCHAAGPRDAAGLRLHWAVCKQHKAVPVVGEDAERPFRPHAVGGCCWDHANVGLMLECAKVGLMKVHAGVLCNRERFHLSQFTGEQIETQLKNLLTLYKKIRDLCAMTGGGGLHDTLNRYDMSLGVYDALGDLYQDNPAVNICPLRKSGQPHAVISSSDDGNDNGDSNGQERSNGLVDDTGGDADSYKEQDGEAEVNTIQAVSSVATPVATSACFPLMHSSVTDNSSSSSSSCQKIENRFGRDSTYESERPTNEMIITMMAQQMQAQTAQQQMFTQLLQAGLPVFLGYMGSHTNQAAIPPPVQQQSIQHGWPPMPSHELSSSQQTSMFTQQPHWAQQYQTPQQQTNPTFASTNSNQAAEQETEELEN